MSELDKFRADFALVWKTWIERNEETPESYKRAGQQVKARMTDMEWMRGAMTHFAKLADAIRRDIERKERIKAEVRAAKERAAA